MASNCETCMNYEYDEEYEYYVCTKNLDEDEMYRFIKGDFRECPYYQFGDEYQIVRKQIQEEEYESVRSFNYFMDTGKFTGIDGWLLDICDASGK